MTPSEESLAHYEAALRAIYQLRQRLVDEENRVLLDELGAALEEAFWLSRLGFRVTPEAIAALPYCRCIPLTPSQGQHVGLLKRGMLEAERALTPGGRSSPWNALLSSRLRVHAGIPRKCFEAGFVMRLFLLLQEARQAAPEGEWAVIEEQGQRRLVLRRSVP